MRKSWKKTAAFVLSLTLIGAPLTQAGSKGGLFGGAAIVASAAEQSETFDTNTEQDTYSGTNVTVMTPGAYSDNDGFYIKTDLNATITVAEGYQINKLELVRGCFSGTPVISSTTAVMTQNGQTFTFTNVNASSVTLKATDACQIKQVKVYYDVVSSSSTDISSATVNLASDNSVASLTIGNDTITDLSGFDITYGTDDSHTATAVPTDAGTYYAYVTPKSTNTAYTGTAKSSGFEIVASAGTTVTTFDELYAAVASGGLVTLGADIVEDDGYIYVGKDATLDLNGHTLSIGEQDIGVSSNSAFTIKDSVGNGKFVSARDSFNILIYSNASFTLESGTLEFTNSAAKGVDVYGGTFIMNGGTINSAGYSIWRDGGPVTINGGTINGGFYRESGSMTINGGIFNFDVTSLVDAGVSVRKIDNLWYVGDSAPSLVDLSTSTVNMTANSADVASVVLGETTLTEGTDYTVSYKQGETALTAKPTASGAYTAVITGTGKYTGEVTKDFTLHVHSYSEDWEKDAEQHWHVCTETIGTCDTPEKDAADHSYGTTGEALFTCSVCGYVDVNKKNAAFAQAVDALIEEIGEVMYTDTCKDKIDYARAAYNYLTEDQKALVTKLEVLTTAEKLLGIAESGQPKDYTGDIGEVASFEVAAAEGVTYQWQFKSIYGWKDSGMTGAKTNKVSVPITAARNNQQYRCVISCNGKSAYTQIAAIRVKATILSQPTTQTLTIGETAKFTVGAVGTNLKYQWQFNDYGIWRNSGMDGAQTATVRIPVTAARDGQQYRCIITENGTTLTSNAASILVPPEITEQPTAQTGTIGSTVKFTVAASGENVKYQWQFKATTGWQNSGMTGAKTAAISVPVTAARDGQLYRCVITSAHGVSVTSNEAKIIAGVKINAQPQDFTGKVGDIAKFTVTADGSNLSYQWQFNDYGVWKNSGMTGAKTATISVPITEKRDGQQYRCIVTSANGTSAVSDSAKLAVGE